MAKTNKYGCRVREDVCLEHSSPLLCKHGCDEVKEHKCEEWDKNFEQSPKDIKLGMSVREVAFTMGRGRRISERVVQLQFLSNGDLFTYTFENDTLISVTK